MPTLQFKGKSFVENHHLTVPYHQLIPDRAASLTDTVSLSDNLIIHGDNLIALKALLPNYQGQVKCVYIDPPYNTGEEGWRYNDNVNSPMIQDWLMQNRPVDKEDMTRHDKWLCMMMPRLTLLRELLDDDGVILISIDDNEVEHLRMLMNEIFGEECHLGTLIWKRRQNVDSRTKNGISMDHEYVLIFGKTSTARLRGQQKDLSKYSNPDNDPRGPWASDNMVGLASEEQRPNLHYDLTNPATGITYPCPPTGWRYGKDTMAKLIANGQIIWPSKPNGRPRYKRYLNELTTEFTGLSTVLNTVYTSHGTRELREMFEGQKVIDFPKPIDYVKLLIEQATDPDENDIVLDSFAGSGTTAHAVLKLNAEDGGNRRFILIEMEDYADTLTAERVRKAIRGVPTSSDKSLAAGISGSFSFFNLGASIDIDAVFSGDPELMPAYSELARYLFYTSTGEEFVPENLDESNNYIGESQHYHVYLFYKPDVEYLQNTALTLEMVRALPNVDEKERLVFAPTHFVDSEYLEQYRVRFVRLPFEIYRFPSS